MEPHTEKEKQGNDVTFDPEDEPPNTLLLSLIFSLIRSALDHCPYFVNPGYSIMFLKALTLNKLKLVIQFSTFPNLKPEPLVRELLC